MKKTTCAVVIINKEGDILGCHSMGSVTYDFPKGCVEPGESDIDAAVRELKEEAGICVDKETLIDCGIYNHNREKYIHIFIKQVSEFPNLNSLYCTTYFERYGKKLEINESALDFDISKDLKSFTLTTCDSCMSNNCQIENYKIEKRNIVKSK